MAQPDATLVEGNESIPKLPDDEAHSDDDILDPAVLLAKIDAQEWTDPANLFCTILENPDIVVVVIFSSCLLVYLVYAWFGMQAACWRVREH